MRKINPIAATLRDLSEADFPTLRTLGETIWHQHYSAIISTAQIDYMLSGRYAPEKLRVYVGAQDRWLKLLMVEDVTVGYCSYSIYGVVGELKLEQLYLLAAFKGKGLGGLMLRHVEAQVRLLGASTIMLTVNKQNVDSIAVYKHAGFTVREEAEFDIGHGYVMDDYVMHKFIG